MLTIDPARRLATALGLEGLGNRAHRVAPEVLKAAGHRGARRALGRDARHEAVVGRPRAAARARRGDRVPHPREPAVHEPHRAVRAEPRLHRDGAPVRDPRERRVRPHRHRHPADAERDRLPRRAGAHGRLLRQPAAALAHAAVPRRRQARHAHHQRREPALLPDGRSHPREQVPPGHRRVLLELPVDVRRLRRPARKRSSGCCTTSARRSRSSPRSKPRRCTKPSGSARRSSTATSISARSILNKTLPDSLRDPDGRRRPRPRASTTPARSPTQLARDRRPGARRSRPHGPRAADGGGVVPELLGRRDARGRAAGRARAACPTSSRASRRSPTTSATSTASTRSAATSSAGPTP